VSCISLLCLPLTDRSHHSFREHARSLATTLEVLKDKERMAQIPFGEGEEVDAGLKALLAAKLNGQW
jgi:hypothetical protein